MCIFRRHGGRIHYPQLQNPAENDEEHACVAVVLFGGDTVSGRIRRMEWQSECWLDRHLCQSQPYR